MHIKASSVVGVIAALPLAAYAEPATSTSKFSSRTSSSKDACASIGSLAGQVRSSAGGLSGIPAKLAHQCLTSTPIEKDVATGYVDQLKEYFEFQSTLAYLKDPPSSYKMPSVDIMGTLDDIKDKVKDGTLDNQYDFDAAILKLTYSSHDGHMNIYGGTIGAFTFELPISLVSVSEDGKKLPEIYVLDDIYLSQSGKTKVSPIDKIDGQDAVDWLTQFGKEFGNAGVVEDHAEFNGLMHNRARAIYSSIEFPSGLSMQYLYPGENFKGTFKNGTSFSYGFTATTPADWEDVTDADVFYSDYVRSMSSSTPTSLPASSSKDNVGDSLDLQAPPATSTLSPVGKPYPDNPVVRQVGFGGKTEPMGVIGYHLKDESIGVLCIPSFMAGSLSTSWLHSSETVQKFLKKSKDAGMKKIVIDLQGNGGGISFLGLDIFKQFFPDTVPYAGGRFRTHEAGKILGNIFTDMALDPKADSSLYSWSPWDEERWSDEEGRDFANWDDLFEPIKIHDDTFTQVIRENLTHAYLDQEELPINVFGQGPRSSNDPQPYDSDDILLLQDGFCGSTCVLFEDMMRVHHGVKTVAVGGIPKEGPMQGAAGTRGGLVYDLENMVKDINTASGRNPKEAKKLPNFSFPYIMGGGGVNLFDQLHEGDDTPLQFKYMPSSCRIWYTPEMIVDYTHLWKAAASAIWDEDSDLCIKDSITEGPKGDKGTNGSGGDDDGDDDDDDDDDEGDEGDEGAASSVLLSRGLVVVVSLMSTAVILL